MTKTYNLKTLFAEKFNYYSSSTAMCGNLIGIVILFYFFLFDKTFFFLLLLLLLFWMDASTYQFIHDISIYDLMCFWIDFIVLVFLVMCETLRLENTFKYLIFCSDKYAMYRHKNNKQINN